MVVTKFNSFTVGLIVISVTKLFWRKLQYGDFCESKTILTSVEAAMKLMA